MFTNPCIKKPAMTLKYSQSNQYEPRNRISCVWPGALDVPASIKRWCRAHEILIDLDAYMRVRFRGRKQDILVLIANHIADNNPELAGRIVATITEA